MPPLQPSSTTPRFPRPATGPVTRIRRSVLRILARLTVTLGVLWYALHLVEAPAETFPSAVRHQLEWALFFIAGCGACLVLVEIGRTIASRAQD